ncbi:ArnT family glycosyltransferase [Variovorax atrisoli]|uniref:ArnT family glycosyltransferase n=2 Tax=Variovorax atrisoli TaxID=3394203 RepID=UPI00056DF806|nr:glycosyl transferase [Variovorax sp. 369]
MLLQPDGTGDASVRAAGPAVRDDAPSPIARPRGNSHFASAMAWMALWAVTWLCVLSALHLTPPTDSVEQLTWVRSIEWGYHKHPPLPTMMIWPLVQLFGIHEWVVSAAGALVICGALVISWRLVRELAGSHFAALAMLGSLNITYYSGRLDFYNHNTVLLLFVAASAWFCWRAFADRSRVAWLALGLMLGLGALAKYQVALAALSVIAFWLTQRGWRDPLHLRGLLGAAAVAFAVFAPHLWWLVTHDFLPLRYARHTSLGAAMTCAQRTAHALLWLADQLNRLSPALLLAAGLLWKTRSAAAPASRQTGTPPPEVGPDARAFLFIWGLLPLTVIVLIGLATGADLQFQWGTAFMSFTCAALMLLLPMGRWHRIERRDATTGFLAVQILLFALTWVMSPMSGLGLSKSKSAGFRSEHFAARIGPPARVVLGGPVMIVGGSSRIASAIALRLPERPLVLLEGDLVASPWVSVAQVERHGVLWVGDEHSLPPPPGLERHWVTGKLWWAVQLPRPDAD